MRHLRICCFTLCSQWVMLVTAINPPFQQRKYQQETQLFLIFSSLTISSEVDVTVIFCTLLSSLFLENSQQQAGDSEPPPCTGDAPRWWP